VFLLQVKTAYEFVACLVGSERCIRDRCYMAPKDYVKMGRRQAAIMAATFIKQLNAMMEEGEPVILSPDTFKVVRSES